jgi:23S rRNA-/tRNA-specific pseudouridylate synthase
VNKPCGLPTHATVDNVLENVLALFQKEQQKEEGYCSSSSSSSYALLPQQLNTETSGIMMVATEKKIASYMCRLLQRKIEGATNNSILQDDPAKIIITKRYHCLVGISNQEQHETLIQRMQSSSTALVTHYLDAQL